MIIECGPSGSSTDFSLLGKTQFKVNLFSSLKLHGLKSMLHLLERGEFGDEFLLAVTGKTHGKLSVIPCPLRAQHDTGSVSCVPNARPNSKLNPRTRDDRLSARLFSLATPLLGSSARALTCTRLATAGL